MYTMYCSICGVYIYIYICLIYNAFTYTYIYIYSYVYVYIAALRGAFPWAQFSVMNACFLQGSEMRKLSMEDARMPERRLNVFAYDSLKHPKPQLGIHVVLSSKGILTWSLSYELPSIYFVSSVAFVVPPDCVMLHTTIFP